MGSFFVHSALAWATLALISIPIIIHLINRRRFRRIDWAAMEFLLDALKKNRRRVRIEQLILLLLRIALMALLGFLLARPILSDRGLEWLSGAFLSEDKVFIWDDSFSTTHRAADRSAFDRAREALQGQVRRLAERSANDRLTILRASRHKTPLVRGIFVDRERALELVQSIARVPPTDTRFPLVDTLEAVVEASARENTDAARPRAVSIFTDLRATDWTNGQGGPDERLLQALQRLTASEESPTRILLLDVGQDDTENVAVTQVRVEGGSPIAEIPAELRVEVTNFGLSSVRGLGVRVKFALAPVNNADDRAATVLGPALEDIAPGKTVVTIVPCTFRTPGSYGVTVELTGARDSLPGDDTLALAVDVASGTDVLLVSGEPSSEPFDGETDFLAAALAPAGEVPSGVRPLVVLEDAIPTSALEKYALIFLCNLHSIPGETLAALGRYVRSGGTLVLFLGDQIDATLYNRQLIKGTGDPGARASPEQGLLPARIGELRNPEDPFSLAPEFDHAYFRLLRDAKDLPAMARFDKHFFLEPVANAQVVARFDGADRSAAIVEHAVDDGRVILIATSADTEWHDWPQNPSYLMTLQEIVHQAVRARSATTQHLAGHSLMVPVDVATQALEATLRTPGHPTEPEMRIVARPAPQTDTAAANANLFRFEINDTDRAGLYALERRNKAGESTWTELAVRRDPQESNLQRVTPAKLRELYPGIDLTVVKDTAGFVDVGRGSFEISDALLWAFLAFIFVESFLARLFAHHPAPAPGGAKS